METEVRTVGSVRETKTLRGRVALWVLLEGDRRVIAGVATLAVVALFAALISAGVLAVGPNSSAATVFGSGLTSGVVTVVTIALSINQLILSRVFGTPDVLSDRLDAARDLRRNVERLAKKPSSPSDPAAFLSTVARALSDRASDLLGSEESDDWRLPGDVTAALRDFNSYGQSIDGSMDDDTTVTDALGSLLGPEYALNMTAVHQLQTEHRASLPAAARTELEAIEELLESIAIVRQFYKTIALQQDFAILSRLIVYSGLLALLTTVSLTLLYRTGSATLASGTLLVVVSVGLGVIVSPLALFAAYILRAATIARQTVSVGPFIPPRER